MAQAKSIKFGQIMMLIGDGETDEQFEAPCGFETLSLVVNIETNTTNVPDCEDPDLPSWLVSDEVSKQMVLSGEGVMDTDAMQKWQEWLMDGGEKNVRWFKDLPSAAGGGYWQAPGILTTYEENGERGQRWRQNIGITLNGKPVWTPATP